MNDEKLYSRLQKKFDEFHQLIERFFVRKIIRIVILLLVIMKECSNEIEKVIVSIGQIRA